MNKCIGCGVKLQNVQMDLPGYVKDLSFSYCERCFRNKNYSEIKEEKLAISNQDIINKINDSADLTFFITDLLNISSEVISLYNGVKTDKYLVINKMDIIPKDIKQNKISDMLKKEYGITNHIIYTSCKDNNLTDYFNNYHNIYFCGITNSGKTSLIAKISGNSEITSSSMLNTTLDYLDIYYDSYHMVDCPGFVLDSNKVDSKVLKNINPSKLLKIRSYLLKEGTILNIQDIIKVGFTTRNKVSCYVSNGLIIKKEYHIEELEPVSVFENCDLIILGIGFLNIKEQGTIMIDKNLKYEVRKSIF